MEKLSILRVFCHHNDVIMTTIASQITSLTAVYSTVYSDADQRKHQSSASLAFVWGIHRDRWIPRTKTSYAENVSIWWRHHVREIHRHRRISLTKVMLRFGVSFVVNANKLLNKRFICWWFETPRCSCDVTLMTKPMVTEKYTQNTYRKHGEVSIMCTFWATIIEFVWELHHFS